MRTRSLLLATALTAAAPSGCAGHATDGPHDARTDPGPDPGTGPDLAAELATLAGVAIYFGHQSVGGQLMDAVATLLAGNAGPEPTLLAAPEASQIDPGDWAHAYIGQNQAPLTKLDAFRAALSGPIGGRVQIAFVKLCYVDAYSTAAESPSGLFASYQGMVAAVQAERPGVRLVHVTMPLVTVAAESSDGWASNARREAYNDLLRRAYGAQVFDLALLEATDPTGAVVVNPASGARGMYAGWSSDGGHLNAAGAARIGRALVAHLSSTLR